MIEPDDQPPRDIVPPSGLTLETLRRLNDATDTEVIVTEPGEVLTDLDGVPTGVGPTTTTRAMLAGATVTLREVLAAGGRPEDFPNLTIVDTTKENPR